MRDRRPVLEWQENGSCHVRSVPVAVWRVAGAGAEPDADPAAELRAQIEEELGVPAVIARRPNGDLYGVTFKRTGDREADLCEEMLVMARVPLFDEVVVDEGRVDPEAEAAVAAQRQVDAELRSQAAAIRSTFAHWRPGGRRLALRRGRAEVELVGRAHPTKGRRRSLLTASGTLRARARWRR